MWIIRNQYFRNEFWDGDTWSDLKRARTFKKMREAELTAFRVGGTVQALQEELGNRNLSAIPPRDQESGHAQSESG